MASDIERSYTGTNFAVITLAILLAAVLSYYVVAQIQDMSDDQVSVTQKATALR